ncbi:cation transporter [Heliorestis convoluta]|uniref:Copper chaperone CopZ n=1 Tax=Heliorestis convoluta TaxID=356322 RepID=A0A5Q2N2S7_9FIRM|nr:cation transporter [Heliorestis convoluta]QGG49117.1 copper chaperone CopZ [Heliorestis convoluta]
MLELTLHVEGMSCGHCKAAVEGALQKVEGVKEVAVFLEEGTVTIRFDAEKTAPEVLIELIEEEGYEVLD